MSEPTDAYVVYNSHIQDIGWQGYVSSGTISGTVGLSKRMEAIKIGLIYYNNVSSGIEYSTHVQNIGWQNFVANDAISGTTGQSLRIEAIKIRLTAMASTQFDVYYQCHVQNIGWMGWAKNGEPAGMTGNALRVEAIKIILLHKGDPAPGDTSFAFVLGPKFRYPVNFIGITELFSSSHYALDFGFWEGNPNPPVYSAMPGIVDTARFTAPDTAGKYVRIRSDDPTNNCTWYTLHKHLDSINVNVGDSISVGDQVGIMGGTGGYPVHLHFDLVRVGYGQGYNQSTQRAACSVNPLNYLYKYPGQTIATYSLGSGSIKSL